MSRWYVKRRGSDVHGSPTVVTVVECTPPEYHGEWMGDEYITVDVKEPEPVDFHLEDYVEYRGEKYSICYDPNVIKKARRYSYGEGFCYDSIKFYAAGWRLKTIDFKDVVLYDNNLAYTSLSEFSFFAGSVEDLADRLQANLDRVSTDWIVLTPNWARCKQRAGQQRESDFEIEWEYYYDDVEKYGEWYDGSDGVTLGETDININVTSEQMCWDMLKASYEQFGLSYYIQGMTPSRQGNVIVIGGAPIREPQVFRYGKGNGLYEIERTSDEDQELVTKVFGYGSETNLPLNYYANIGKKVKFTVWKKVRKTYISGHPTYYFWIDAIWDTSLSNAFPNLNVIVSRGQHSAKFLVSGSSTIFSDTEPRETNLGSPHLNFYWIDYGETDAYDLWQNVSVGDTIYIEGANINAMPSQYVEIPHEYDYPTLLSINKLMLPGFPDMTLHDWLTACSQDSSVDRGQWGGLSAEDATSMLQKYDFSGIEVGPEPPSTASEAVKRAYEESLRKAKLDPWIRSRNATTIGVYEGAVNFDGSEQKEIYPTIENTTSGSVVMAQTIIDNGYVGEKADIDFNIFVRRGESYLDWKDALSTAIDESGVYIEMTSGFCVGRKFKVKSASDIDIPSVGSLWCLNCEREKDSSLERYFPYFDNDTSHYCQVLGGDTFVVTGIQMPDLYVRYASTKLLIAVCGWLDRRDHVRYTYVPKVDEIWMARQHDTTFNGSTYNGTSLHDTLKAGMQFQFEDSADLGIERYSDASPFIDQLTIKEDGNNGIPTYDVVLRDEKEKGALEKLAESIDDLKGATVVTERSTKQPIIVNRGQWTSGTSYYYETLNTETGEVETSRVDAWGIQWECRRSFTSEMPGYGCQDWVTVEDIAPVLVLDPPTGYSHNLAIGETVVYTVKVWFGNYRYGAPIFAQDVTSMFSISAERDDLDPTFAAQHSNIGGTLTMTFAQVFGGRNAKNATITVTAIDTTYTLTAITTITRKGKEYTDNGQWTNDQPYDFHYAVDGDLSMRDVPTVWNYGICWECTNSGTTEEPSFGCDDWTPVGGQAMYFLEFTSTKGYSFRKGYVDTVIEPHLYFGLEDITDSTDIPIANWNWTRRTENESGSQHTPWNNAHESTKSWTMTNVDMPDNWSYGNKTIFTCTVTIDDGEDTVIVENQIVS